MITTNITSAAAHVQGLQAFMASEAKAAATDTQLEEAAGGVGPQQPYTLRYMCTSRLCEG